ncbi:MAG: hypothetical protein AAFZ07_28440 [Actinomycetota bacterium]
MAVTTAWTSTDQAVLDAWEEYRAKAKAVHDSNAELRAALETEFEEWLAERDATLKLIVRRHDRVPIGISFEGTTDVPARWRRRRDDLIVPDRRSTYGREWADRINWVGQTSSPTLDAPGMPGGVFGFVHGGHWYTPAGLCWEGEVWLGWGVPDGSLDAFRAEIDLSLWAERRLSEWHLTLEAVEAAEAAA